MLRNRQLTLCDRKHVTNYNKATKFFSPYLRFVVLSAYCRPSSVPQHLAGHLLFNCGRQTVGRKCKLVGTRSVCGRPTCLFFVIVSRSEVESPVILFKPKNYKKYIQSTEN